MRFNILAVPMMIFIELVVMLNFVEYNQQAIYEIEEELLDIQVNYAVDASVQAMLESTGDIDAGYTDWGRIKLDPQVAYDTYVAMLLRNFGWSDSAKNRADLEGFAIPYFCVATYDGYYLWKPVREVTTAGVSYPLKASPKMPYYWGTDGVGGSFDKTDDGFPYYCLNFSLDKADKIDRNGSSIVLQKNAPSPITRQKTVEVINYTLADEITKAIYVRLDGHFNGRYSLPAKLEATPTTEGTLPVLNPTVITTLIADDGMSKFDHMISGFGAAKIDTLDSVVCYKVGTTKYFHYLRNVNKSTGMINRNGASYIIERVYKEEIDALREGYEYDVYFLGK